MTSRSLLLILFSFLFKSLNGQNLYPIKSQYDNIYFNSNISPLNFDYNNCYNVGNGLSWVLSSLVRMYESTGDKAYLIKFINHSIQIQNVRKDMQVFGDVPVWIRPTDDVCDANIDGHEPAYFNSLLIFPMAEFVNLIINEPGHELYNTNLPLQLINNLPSSPTIITYGDFANWLGKKVEETIFYMTATYWDDSFGIKGHFTDECFTGLPRTCGSAMNFNSPFGTALLFMGLSNTNFGYGNNRAFYLDKAQTIAELYKGNVNIVDLCSCSLTSDCDSYLGPVLQLMPDASNSYFWYHSGWGVFKNDCLNYLFDPQPQVHRYVEFIEDVSHGAMDLWFVNACYDAQLAPTNLSSPYFTSIEMERFKNTLTKNIYYTDNTGAHFHNGVNGTNSQITSPPGCSSNCPPDIFWGEILDWMPLYKFDDNSNLNVYDILINYTTGVMQNTSTQNSLGPQGYLGLSEVIKAQWDKECINLTLYNRDIAYDQDFFVKNNLVVAPELDDDFHDLGDNSFADPIIQDNTFTIPANINVNMVAGESISLLPGFSAKAGSFFSASINPNECSDGKMMSNNSNNNNIHSGFTNDLSSSKKSDSKNEEISVLDKIKIYPNPNEGIFNISLPTDFSLDNLSIEIYDNLGSLKYSDNKLSNSFDLSTYSNGIYFLIIKNNQGIFREKIIKQ